MRGSALVGRLIPFCATVMADTDLSVQRVSPQHRSCRPSEILHHVEALSVICQVWLVTICELMLPVGSALQGALQPTWILSTKINTVFKIWMLLIHFNWFIVALLGCKPTHVIHISAANKYLHLLQQCYGMKHMQLYT